MSAGEVISLLVLLLMGYLPLVIAVTTLRRWLRVLLALAATFLLTMCACMLLLAGSADEIQQGAAPLLMMALAVICGVSAIGSFVLAFMPVRVGKDFRPIARERP